MSVKIYDGVKINNLHNKTMQEIDSLLKDSVEEVVKCQKNIFIEIIVKNVAEEFVETNDLGVALQNIKEEFSSKSPMRRGDHYKHSFEIVLIPHNDKTLAIPMEETNGVLLKKFTHNMDVEEYPYWNGTDKPENISQEEWDNRLNEYMDDNAIAYGDSGLSMKIKINWDEELKNKLITHLEKINNYEQQLKWLKYRNETIKDILKEEGTDVKMSRVVEIDIELNKINKKDKVKILNEMPDINWPSKNDIEKQEMDFSYINEYEKMEYKKDIGKINNYENLSLKQLKLKINAMIEQYIQKNEKTFNHLTVDEFLTQKSFVFDLSFWVNKQNNQYILSVSSMYDNFIPNAIKESHVIPNNAYIKQYTMDMSKWLINEKEII